MPNYLKNIGRFGALFIISWLILINFSPTNISLVAGNSFEMLAIYSLLFCCSTWLVEKMTDTWKVNRLIDSNLIISIATVIFIVLLACTSIFMLLVLSKKLEASLTAYLLGLKVTAMYSLLLIPLDKLICYLLVERLSFRTSGELPAIAGKLALESDIPQSTDNSKSRLLIALPTQDKSQCHIDLGTLLYIRSADNYVEIFEHEHNQTSRRLIRTSIKSIELRLANKLLKAHRSYLVNPRLITGLIREKQRYWLQLDDCSENIPVSRNQLENCRQHISRHSITLNS